MGAYIVKDLVLALDRITGGRVVTEAGGICGKNRFVVTKSSGIPGKAVTELPGLVCGDMGKEIGKVAVLMTMTESAIELAGAMGVDAMVAHHPLADAASCGGVLLKTYLGLYGIAGLELHEAFHGLHPGIAYLHGHSPTLVDVSYGGIPGNILNVGDALPEVKTLGDMLARIESFMGTDLDEALLESERGIRACPGLQETNLLARGVILLGKPESPVRKIAHIFPHTGFTPEHLEKVVRDHPGVDTVLATISRVRAGHSLVEKARELGLNFICGNSHALEILENGLPLAMAIQALLPGLEVHVFRERMTSAPLESFGTPAIRDYARLMSEKHLAKAGK